MQRMITCIVHLGGFAVACGAPSSNIDTAQRFNWAENIGWIAWQHDTSTGVFVGFDHLSGFAWAENVGWINLGNGGGPYANDPADSSTFGVNVGAGSGKLTGLAWSENVGWINFNTEILDEDRAIFLACEHRFTGYAWGENVGWINLDDAIHFVGVGPCAGGDLDCDGAVMLNDFASFASALRGPDVTTPCSAYDVDDDSDVDLIDVSVIQRAFAAAP